MKNLILVEPQGGLGNRMRVIASGLWLGEMTGKKIEIVWTLNKNLNCPFEELFEPLTNFEIIPKKLLYYYFRSLEQKSVFKKSLIRIINTLVAQDYTIIEDTGAIRLRSNESGIVGLFKSGKIPYFRTCEEFGNLKHEFRRFVPLPDLVKKNQPTVRPF